MWTLQMSTIPIHPGLIAPATDVLIAAGARHHGAEIEHADADFDASRVSRDARSRPSESPQPR